MVKLVNYVRRQVQRGQGRSLDLSTSSIFDDDQYLQPVLEDDALLYSLEDIIHDGFNNQPGSDTATAAACDLEEGTAAYTKISRLHEALLRSQQEALAAQQRLEIAEKALRLSRQPDAKEEISPSATSASARRLQYKGNYDGPGEDTSVTQNNSFANDQCRTPSDNDSGQGPH